MSKLKTLVKTTLTPIALCLTLAIAAPAIAKKNHHQKHDVMRQILSELSLTDTQKQDVRHILKQTREDRDLFSTDAKSLKNELRRLVHSTEWDQAAIETAITQSQAQMQTKALQRASNKNQVWNLLSDTQQADLVAKLDTLKAELKTHKSKGKEKGTEEGKKGVKKGKRKGNKLKRLDLTEVQFMAFKAIKTEAKASGEEIKANLKGYKQAERALIYNTGFDAQTWQTLHSQYQADFLAMALLKAKTKHDIWNQLTPEQQAKAEGNSKGKKGKHGNKGKHNKKHQKQDSV